MEITFFNEGCEVQLFQGFHVVNVTDESRRHKVVQGVPAGLGPGLGCLRFGMFHHTTWAVGSCSSGPPAKGTPQMLVNPTQVRDLLGHPVQRFSSSRSLCFVMFICLSCEDLLGQ